MPEVNENKIFNALLNYKGAKTLKINEAEIDISLNPVDIHNVDSPDFLIWIDMSVKVFGQDLRVRFPIPVEAEKGGIRGGALEDLRKFIERGNYPIEIPMLVISESGFETKKLRETFIVDFTLSQIPVRLIDGKISKES